MGCAVRSEQSANQESLTEMTDKAFLMQCTCAGDVCQCDHFSSTDVSINQINSKGTTTMPTNSLFTEALSGTAIRGNFKLPLSGTQRFSKLSEYLKACSAPDREGLIDDILANADSLPVATLKRMSKALSAKAAAKEASQSVKAQRLARLSAAMENQADDPQVSAAVNLARGELRRLGLSINASGPDGFNVFELDAKMKELGWSDERRTRVKAACIAIGVIE
jgi:hypothetical protein